MGRVSGALFINVLQGTNINHSYARFRRRLSQVSCYRKMVCGADVVKCGGADPCGGKAEAYVNILVTDGGGNQYKVGRTQTCGKTNNPRWEDQICTLIDTEDPASVCIIEGIRPFLSFQILDDDGGGDYYYEDDLLGESIIYLDELEANQTREFSLKIKHPKDKDSHSSEGKLQVKLHFASTADSNGIPVPHTYFKRRKNNRVRLYHDAHCEPGDFEAVGLGGPLAGRTFPAYNCWEDIYDSINAARHVIFVCGWSVNTAISLKRCHERDGEGKPVGECPENIGELLKRKSEQGVSVCVMIWDDVTSGNALSKAGLMGTYDEYTRAFFASTGVRCVLAKRIAGDDQGVMVGAVYSALKSTSFTHHQKIVVCDAHADPSQRDGRHLVAYVGGLDLTSGRYDTGRHELFGSLQCEHAGDFYNGCNAEANAERGPREPWHDIHSRVEGPGAWDVLANFLERLQKQDDNVWSLMRTRVNLALQEKRIKEEQTPVVDATTDPSAWSCQVFRSIDTESAVFTDKFARKYYHAPKKLMCDKSIQLAYLYAISRSKRFIYIENQYFLGSSQYWLEHRDAPAPHLVPYALAKRAVRAIARREDFCIYVMTPLFPEGIPSSSTVQEILHWQYQTMRFMYRQVHLALKQYNATDRTVFDYLQFVFPATIQERPARLLGRETAGGTPTTQNSEGAQASPRASPRGAPANSILTSQWVKFQIYVHSKMMMVDDEWLIVGSANINERSMAGCRDSEIAVGLSQDYCNCTVDPYKDEPVLPKGDIYGFRMQLWQEHLGALRKEFEDPGTTSCARLFRRWTSANLEALLAEKDLGPLPHGHACRHPTDVDEKTGELLQCALGRNIINTASPVIGCRSAFMPGPLTT